MSLEYKTQAYIRKAIRQAEYAQVGSGIWSAVLPTLGLRTTGESREDAEQNLLIMITAYVLGAPQFGWPLPSIDDVDFGIDGRPGYRPDDVYEPEADEEVVTSSTNVEKETVLGAAPESLMLTARESLVVAEAIVHPPAANAYLLRAAQEYREFMGL